MPFLFEHVLETHPETKEDGPVLSRLVWGYMCSKASCVSLNELLGRLSYLPSYAYTLLCMYVCMCVHIWLRSGT